MRKFYASQESVAETLTQCEMGASDAHASPVLGASAPFVLALPDAEPLPAVTREAVIVEGDAVTSVDPRTGAPVAVRFLCDDAGGGP